ncbi:MAG: hypothetical protein OHK0022_29150 [Roseiflexaceae bacterium]
MKMYTRTVVILAAALLVCGLTLGLVNAGVLPEPEGRGFEQGQLPQGAQIVPGQDAALTAPQGNPDGQGFAGRRPGGPHGEGGRGGFAAFELLKNLAIVAVVVLVVAPIAGWLDRRRTDPPTAPTIRL